MVEDIGKPIMDKAYAPMHLFYAFNPPKSRLHLFIIKKQEMYKETYSLLEIYTTIRKTIMKDGAYDVTNESMILCTEELEDALGVKACHASQLPDIVLPSLKKLKYNPFEKIISESLEYNTGMINSPEMINRTDPQWSQVIIPYQLTGYYRITVELLNVFKTLPDRVFPNKNQELFSYTEVIALLNSYLLHKRDVFVDPRNKSVAIIEGDLLSWAFKTKAFHSSQTRSLLESHMIYHGL